MKNKVFIMMLLLSLVQVGPAVAEIKFGTLPRINATELQRIFNPLMVYLSKETGENVTFVTSRSFQSFKEDVEAARVDIGFSNPLVYVQIKDKANIEPLALSAEIQSGTRMRGIIIARKDSGFTKVADLRGKKLIFVDKDSAAGYIYQTLLLSKAGLDINKDFEILPFGKKHENVAAAVVNKTADAGGIREDELQKIKGKVDISKLQIIGYTDYFANWPFFATSKLSPEMAGKIKAALLKLKPNDPSNEPILKSARLTGFIPVSDREYDNLRAAARIAGAL